MRRMTRSLGLSLIMSTAAWAAAPFVPPVEGLDQLAGWTAGVQAADSGTDPLVIVCIGDSNTEIGSYTVALRELLQGCYGERGLGYHTLGERSPIPDAPKLEKQGRWTNLHIGPEIPPTPWFAPDLLWTETDDPQASLTVTFPAGAWGKGGDSLARAYDGRQRFRIHYQTGPDLGSFAVFAGDAELVRVETKSEKPGYGLTEGFLAPGFRIAGIQGKVILNGYDGIRESYVEGKSVLPGGALVHALGRGWGQAAHFCRIEQETFSRILGALKPDLITILLGTNDMHNEGIPDRYRNNLTTLIQKLRLAAPKAGILVIGCPEAAQTKAGFAAQYRDIAREVAAQNQCAFWSLTDLIGERSRDWTREGFFGDGLHYNRLGGSLWARLLLRQLGFDLNDLKHYPALVPRPPKTGRPELAIKRVPGPEALATEPPLVLWRQDKVAAELRLGLAGGSLAMQARVFGANPDASIELYVAKGPTNAVRQLVFRRDKVTLHENGKDMPAPDLKPVVTPLDPLGFAVQALIPMDVFGLEGEPKEFWLESAAVTAPVKGIDPEFVRLFARQVDGGAFRDSSQSAHVTVKP